MEINKQIKKTKSPKRKQYKVHTFIIIQYENPSWGVKQRQRSKTFVWFSL